MTLFKPNGSKIIVEASTEEIVEIIKSDFTAVAKVYAQENGNIYLEMKDRTADCKFSNKQFNDIFELFEELVLFHAYNGLAGYEFELTRRT